MPNSAKQCQNSSVFHTPRFSFRVSETVICACPRGPAHRGRTRMCTSSGAQDGTRVGIPGGYTGWVIPGSGVLPSCRALRSQNPDSEAGPGSPHGGWSGWSGSLGPPPFACDPVRPPSPYPPLRGPVGPCGPSLVGAGSSGKNGEIRVPSQ